jgi:predicted amidophosphoribosyltransferase
MDIKRFFGCPVCRAKFRGTRQCSRCGADLTGIMVLSARAQRYRENARKSLYALNFEKAQKLAAVAQKEHATEMGRRLLMLTSWLKAEL